MTPEDRTDIDTAIREEMQPHLIIAMIKEIVAESEWSAWHAGWSERSKLGGPPACPSDYYTPGPYDP